MKPERLYHIEVVNDKTGYRKQMTGYPMIHKECMTMRSKMTQHKDTRYELIEVTATEENKMKPMYLKANIFNGVHTMSKIN
ncbi:hypothetical protein [Crenothrix sp.]|uniref:hypothetical protein n=1 Tax=Crenothrix sp. TaxID=3100433 RepID=UPI00374D5142